MKYFAVTYFVVSFGMIRSFPIICGVLILARWTGQFILEWLNRRQVQAHASEIPAAFREMIDLPTYQKSVQYTLAKSAFHIFDLTWGMIVLLAALFTGVLSWFYDWFQHTFGTGIWAGAAFLLVTGFLFSIPDLPLE